ncbi:ABC transporter permease [Rhodococcus sp. NPDC058521]|uniref:ABC transporter permease n=1 Tax=Rhodococcus sp. NPDC058521 TaxID=3346536 RepID=UPI00364EF3E7
MNTVTNSPVTFALVARVNRTMLATWTIAIVGLVAGATAGIAGLYPTALDRAAYAAVSSTVTVGHALNGPPVALTTLGGITVFEAGWYVALAVAAFAIVLVARNSRGAEESGRLELLRSCALGTHSMLVSVTGLSLLSNLVIGTGAAAALVIFGADLTGAVVYGGALAAIGIFFTAVTALAAQITESTRGTYAIAGGVLGASFAVRAVGDATGNSTISWFSPLGWAQASHPFDSNRWWPLLVCVGAAVLLFAAAMAVEARRDLGAGLVRPRPGNPTGGAFLASPVGLALRLHRPAIIGWAATALGLGAAFGAVGADAGRLGESSEAMLDLIGGFGGGDLVDSYFAMTAVLLAVVAAGGALGGALRSRAEEQTGRADILLATALSRPRWLTSHLAVAAATSVTVLVAGGLGMGVAHTVRTGEGSAIPRLVWAALAHAPAVGLVLGIGVVLIGVIPRAASVVWIVFAGCAVATILGPTLRLPAAVMNLSPFEHTPRLPGPVEAGTAGALALMTALAVALIACGFAGFRRRDIG